MQNLIIILLTLAVVVLISYCLSLSWGLRRTARQFSLRLNGDTATRLPVPCPNAAVEELLLMVNRLIELLLEERATYQRQVFNLRRQIANVSHDLRTPLTSILGYLQLLEQADLPEEKRQAYLSVIKGRARTLQTFISAFYDLSRIEGGEWPLNMEQIQLARSLSDQLADTYEQLEQSGLTVQTDLESDLPPVWADRNAVTRIFSNLLTNALRHGAGSLSIHLYRKEDWVVSSFSNEATAMTDQDAAHVFERFYTADQTRSGQDTGLGLAIVQALAQRMDCQTAACLEHGVFTLEVCWPLKHQERAV